ncbi:MAG TPA: carboxypeptidase-like regulatory domain-containing protein, partial [Arenibacter sp.]|nr:carboxypeptidase-like regulatory domain-containing protein [Arenibacter sp.]
MKNIPVILALYLISSVAVVAQAYKVSGSVIQRDTMEIPFANLLLYRMADTSFVKGAVSDKNGFFSFHNIAPDGYLLRASYMGNSSEELALQLNSDLDVGPLLVDNKVQELKEVVVVSNRPTVEQKIDRLVFNIGNTALSESNIWEVLKSTPSIFVMNNEITIKGEKGVKILINGKKVNLSASDILNLLNGTSANSVEAIEVITAPPSRYDAEGSSMINIRM